jgi:hypothetical protein
MVSAQHPYMSSYKEPYGFKKANFGVKIKKSGGLLLPGALRTAVVIALLIGR